jgi:hypothetical protein
MRRLWFRKLVRLVRLGAVGLAAAGLAAGCSVVLGLDEPRYEDDPVAAEDGATDVPRIETRDGAADSVVGDPSFTDPARWSTYAGAVGGGYLPGAFDGRFVYFIRARDPDTADGGEPPARILRHDTTGDFTSSSSWSSFEPTAFQTGVQLAATFDGRYLIVAGFSTGIFLRHDTRDFGRFALAEGWQSFDSRTFGPSAAAYAAAASLDGGSYFLGINGNRPALRHNGGPSFGAGWETFDAGGLTCTAGRTATTSGPYVYFGPPAGGTTPSCLLRHDTRQPFASAGWETFDIETLAPGYRPDFLGIVGTPAHVYLTRYTVTDAGAPFQILRKPATSAFGEGWEAHSVAGDNPLATGYLGGAFDGTYVYFAPYPARSTTVIYLRYDTRLNYADPAAWTAAAGAALRIEATSHQGALFDGTYVYYPGFVSLAGNHEPLIVRYLAK